jgi:hypothetical protein
MAVAPGRRWLRWRLRSALTHLRVRALSVLGRRLASLAHARRTQLRQDDVTSAKMQ